MKGLKDDRRACALTKPDSFSGFSPNAGPIRQESQFEVVVSRQSVVYFMNGEFPSSSVYRERRTNWSASLTWYEPRTMPSSHHFIIRNARVCGKLRFFTQALRHAIGVITPHLVFTNATNLSATFATFYPLLRLSIVFFSKFLLENFVSNFSIFCNESSFPSYVRSPE